MNSFGSIFNLPVKDCTSHQVIGKLSDVILKNDTNEITAIKVNTGSMLRSALEFNKEDIVTINGDYIEVDASSELGGWKTSVGKKGKRDTKSYQRHMAGRWVFTDDGANLGKIKEGYFDFEMGSLCEFELSGGIANDLIFGRKKLTVDGSVVPCHRGVTVDHVKAKLQSKKESLRFSRTDWH